MIQGKWLEEKITANELFADKELGDRINALTKYKDGLISPLILEYYQIRDMGYSKEYTLQHMEDKYTKKHGF